VGPGAVSLCAADWLLILDGGSGCESLRTVEDFLGWKHDGCGGHHDMDEAGSTRRKKNQYLLEYFEISPNLAELLTSTLD
jgi:hypothetical protein